MIQQHTFTKEEKLKSKKIIEDLFIEGRSVKAYPLRAVYIKTPLPYPDITVQTSVSVSKRNHKLAVIRNRIKRLMREAHRTNKHILDTKGTTFAVLIIYTGRDIISYQEMERKMVKLLNRLQDAITTTHT